MEPLYFLVSGNKAVASIGKVGSTALALAILDKEPPDDMPALVGADPGRGPGWQRFVPKVDAAEAVSRRLEIAIPVRNPVERFRSACSQLRKKDEVEDVLGLLERGGVDGPGVDFHFRSAWASVPEDYEVRLYRFPDHIEALVRFLKLGPLVPANESKGGEKPVLTKEQERRVRILYEKDLQLLNLLEEAGKRWMKCTFVPPPLPVPQSITPVQLRLWALEHRVDLDALVREFPDPVRSAIRLQYAQKIWRQDPMVATGATILGMSCEEADDAFREAAKMS